MEENVDISDVPLTRQSDIVNQLISCSLFLNFHTQYNWIKMLIFVLLWPQFYLPLLKMSKLPKVTLSLKQVLSLNMKGTDTSYVAKFVYEIFFFYSLCSAKKCSSCTGIFSGPCVLSQMHQHAKNWRSGHGLISGTTCITLTRPLSKLCSITERSLLRI